jgi:hypothetical protein
MKKTILLIVVSVTIGLLLFLNKIQNKQAAISTLTDVSPAAPKNSMQGTLKIVKTEPKQESISDQILRLLASSDAAEQGKAYKELLRDWVRRDPRAAAEFAQSPEAAKWHDSLMVVVAQTWTDMDVNASEAWASQLANPTERSMVLGYVAFEEANLDPARSAQVLNDNGLNDDRRTIIVQNLAVQWASQDLNPLYSWIDTQPASAQKDNWYQRVAFAQAENDPAQAAQMVAAKMSPGPAQEDAALYILRLWARQDMDGAAQWASGFPSGLQERAARILNGSLAGAYQPN